MQGICFIPPLFYLTVEERKKQTRRTIPEQPDDDGLHDHTRFPMSVDSDMTGFWGTSAKTGELKEFKPRYKVGERIYLKEPYYYLGDKDGVPLCLYRFQVRGVSGSRSHILPVGVDRWSNKLFMPAKAARFFIEITGVRPERLQDISVEDCIKEGIRQGVCSGGTFWGLKLLDGSYLSYSETPQKAYATLIDSINGKGIWDSNPWMWVYDYKLVENKL